MPVAQRLQRTAIAVLTLAALAALTIGSLDALRAAGLNGIAPPDSGTIKQLFSTLTDNWEWLIATGLGLALTMVGGLLIFGSQRAPDHLGRMVSGILLILVVIPAALA